MGGREGRLAAWEHRQQGDQERTQERRKWGQIIHSRGATIRTLFFNLRATGQRNQNFSKYRVLQRGKQDPVRGTRL